MKGTLLVVRHCQAINQAPNAPLTDTGHQQAQNLAQFLFDYSIDHISTSQYLRAQQTIQPFASNAGLPIYTDARLNERTLSSTQIDNWQEVIQDSFQDHDLSVAGGESSREVLQRTQSVLNEILDAGHSSPLVVSHGNLIAILLNSIDRAFGYEGWFSLTNPDVYMLRGNEMGEVAFERIWSDAWQVE